MIISAPRLWSTLMDLAELGKFCEGGVNRQALSEEEIQAWRQIITWAEEAGLEVSTDPMGNLFIALPGVQRGLPPLLIGSHTDSQPTGGRFDGALGVLAGLEVLRTMVDDNIRPERDIIVVSWMNEEGSRFAPGMSGSEAFAGVRAPDDVLACRDRSGTGTLGDALVYFLSHFQNLPRRPLGFSPFAYLELHIEQGPELERCGIDIGVVTGIQGKKTFRVVIEGEAGHAGTVPMGSRRDSVHAFADLAAELFRTMKSIDDSVRFTIGQVTVTPDAPSVIPSGVQFSIDLRHPDSEILDHCGRETERIVADQRGPCRFVLTPLVDAAPNRFSEELQNRIMDAARRCGFSSMPVLSTAGHDARNIVKLCPGAMIFVPSRHGVSHAPEEWTSAEQVAAGAEVLAMVAREIAEA
ncbi:hydantoinase/carbamoylase family amidase [Acetobacter musti]|uniref:Hydantoinase/carbamoylase family amidase n=1 Tax=Acetobacter musti TaxID=864732 RepID=A0ABX0JQA0_9PROT|nr:M20 family metallo-hydrolase [Acetobacter musti]NHN84949.1 hydantoinase/carbamoylase family amidase [Acetobacter musti]